jgi:hypothetical protein
VSADRRAPRDRAPRALVTTPPGFRVEFCPLDLGKNLSQGLPRVPRGRLGWQQPADEGEDLGRRALFHRAHSRRWRKTTVLVAADRSLERRTISLGGASWAGLGCVRRTSASRGRVGGRSLAPTYVMGFSALGARGPILIRAAAERIRLELFATKRDGPGVRWLSMRRAACQFGNGPYGLCASWHGFFDNPNGPRGLLYRPPLKLLCRMH